jgi:hypothetical protein
LKLRDINARWIPHLLIDELKIYHVENAKKLLKLYPKLTKNTRDNYIVTGEETCVYYFESKLKSSKRLK